MPTILFVLGWRFFFYSNERNEPIHIHCQKAEMECKYWMDIENFALEEAYAFSERSLGKRGSFQEPIRHKGKEAQSKNWQNVILNKHVVSKLALSA